MICTPYIEAQAREWRQPEHEVADDAPPTDEALMTAVAVMDDREAFAELFRRWHRRLRSYFWRRLRDDHLADDLASETFLMVFKSRATFRTVSTFERWLFRCGRNRLFAHWRRRSLPTTAEHAPAIIPSREPTCDERLIAAETVDVVQEVVCGLPEREFELVRRIYWQESNQVEVAQDDGISWQAVSSRLQKCHEVIRNDSRVQYVLFGQRIELREVVAA